MKLDELGKELYALNSEIKRILRTSGFEECGEVEVECDAQNPDEIQLANEYCRIVEKLDDISCLMEYFSLPVAKEGKLHLNQNGRYELNGVELTSGESVEVLLYDRCMERREWFASRIESSDGKYYLVGKSSLDLEGLTARQRKRRW